MHVITALNEKGGIGKTTVSVTVGAGLAIRGARVLLLDADAQANATTSLNLEEQPGLYDLLVRERPFNEVLHRVSAEVLAANDQPPKGELLVVPSNVETRNIASSLPDVHVVRERLADLEGWADVVIIDTPPTPSLFHAALLVATDYVIFPCTCEALAMEGLDKSMGRLRGNASLRVGNNLPATEPLGIVPMMYRGSTALHTYNLAQLKERYGALVWPEVPLRIAWSEAAQVRKTVFAYDSDDKAIDDAWGIVDHVEQSIKVR